jgi:hypothetical protein
MHKRTTALAEHEVLERRKRQQVVFAKHGYPTLSNLTPLGTR